VERKMPFKTIFTDEVVEQYTRKGFWGKGTFLDHFERNAERDPEKEYVVDAKGRVSFSNMSKAVNNIAARLVDFGFKKEDRIAVMLPNWVEFFYMHYAVEKIGAVIVPLFINLRDRDVEYILKTTESVGMVIPDYFNKYDYVRMMVDLRKRLNSLRYIFVIGDNIVDGMSSFDQLLGEQAENKYHEYKFDELRTKDTDVYSMRITSGTTARPKIYMYTENGYVNAAYILKERLRLTEKDVMLGIPPISQGIGLWLGFALPTVTGCKVVLQEKFDPVESLNLIEKERVTVAAVVPTQSIKMLNQPELTEIDFSSLRVIQHAGALLPYSIAKEVEEKFRCPVLNCFEASDGPDVCCTSLGDPPEVRYGTVGKPFAGHEVKIMGIDGKELETGQVGEIWSRGPSISAGYYKEPFEVMKETFLEDGWFRHGDLGMIREDGNIVIMGRIKDLIIRGGQNIAPKEIEDLLLTHPKIKEVAVVGMPDNVLGEKCCAFVVPFDSKDPLTFNEMSDYLEKNKLAKFKFPERLEIIEELPMVGSAKIDKRLLVEKIINKLKEEGL
jgi:non-ribosomal peptide synthetase component E (peptide arylation enzyme)